MNIYNIGFWVGAKRSLSTNGSRNLPRLIDVHAHMRNYITAKYTYKLQKYKKNVIMKVLVPS